jgi:phage/plasmid primase-like uncharacterized protein
MATPTSLPAAWTTAQVLTSSSLNNLRGAFRILQVVSTTKTDTFSASLAAGATADITGLTATITPSATSSLVLVVASVGKGTYGGIVLKRGATEIGIATAVSNRNALSAVNVGASNNYPTSQTMIFLDSPATTSATTYTVALHSAETTTQTAYCNRSDTDTDSGATSRTASTITVMEISA